MAHPGSVTHHETITRYGTIIPWSRSVHHRVVIHRGRIIHPIWAFYGSGTVIKSRVKGVEVSGIQIIVYDAGSLSKPLEMDNFTFSQITDRVTYIRVFYNTKDIFVGRTGFLLCCNLVRTTKSSNGFQRGFPWMQGLFFLWQCSQSFFQLFPC